MNNSTNSEKAKYQGGLKYFYGAGGEVINLLGENVNKFSAHRAVYTTAYVDDLKAKLAAALAMPATAKEIAGRAVLRLMLKTEAIRVRDKFQSLKTYVESAWVESEWDQQLKKAGSANYVKSQVKWGATQLLGVEALEFIGQNKTKLQAGGENMPDTFETEFQDAVKDFETAYKRFKGANSVKLSVKNAKIKANNAVYDALVIISRDAAVVFKRSKDEMRKQFSYSYQLAVAKGGAASFKGTAVDQFGNGIPDVVITSSNQKYSAVTDSKGYFRITKAKAGPVTFIFTFGDETVELPVTLKAGTAKTVTVTMNVAVEEVVNIDASAPAAEEAAA